VSSGSCQFLPAGGFGLAFTNDPSLPGQIGCPVGSPPVVVSLAGATQVFERGVMVWLDGLPSMIYVFFSNSTFQRFEDNFDPNIDPASGGESPPQGLREPVRGFGKIWRAFANVRSSLGWAVSQESSVQATVQDFDRGRMIHLPTRGDILVLMADGSGATATSGTWRSITGGF
jgi:hypothetical protein